MPTLITNDFGQVAFRDTVWTKQPRATSPWERFSYAQSFVPASTYGLYDDFLHLDTAATNGFWKVVKGTGGSLGLAGPGPAYNSGWISIPTAASASDYQYLFTQTASFVLDVGSPIAFEAYLNCTEAATNAANWFVGFTSVITGAMLGNSGGGPPSSYSGAVFFKPGAALPIYFETSNGSTQNTTAALSSEVSGQSYICGCYIDPNDGTTAIARYWLSTVTGTVQKISLLATGTVNLTLASLAAMTFGFGVKNAATSTAETITVDYVRAQGIRALL